MVDDRSHGAAGGILFARMTKIPGNCIICSFSLLTDVPPSWVQKRCWASISLTFR